MDNSTQLEMDARNMLDMIHGRDGSAALTKDSGAARGDGDVKSSSFMVECKYRSTEGFSVGKKEFDKAKEQALRQGLDLMFIRRNIHNETVVLMDIHTFINWMSHAFPEGRE